MARTKVFDEHLVLDKAMRLFWEKGYNATSAQDLVDILGISRSSLYDTYGDKHSLFVKALKRYREERIDPVLQEVVTTEDVEGYFKSFFGFIKSEAINGTNPVGCFMVNSAVEMAPVDPEVAAIANGIMNDMENALCKAIEKGQKKGIFTKQYNARSLANFVFNSVNGLKVTAKFDVDQKMFDDVIRITLSALKK
jgi:TetR/AcrR family transcriptional repressor of nem operon